MQKEFCFFYTGNVWYRSMKALVSFLWNLAQIKLPSIILSMADIILYRSVKVKGGCKRNWQTLVWLGNIHWSSYCKCFYLGMKNSYLSNLYAKLAVPEISILPPWKIFSFEPRVHPGNSNLASYFASKILTFKTPLPLEISDDLPWGGYGFFLELHNEFCTELFPAFLHEH